MTPPHTPHPYSLVLFQGRGRSKAAADPILPDPLISVLIGELDVLVSCVKRYMSVVQRYYSEYLKGAHLSSLRKLVQVAAHPKKGICSVSDFADGDVVVKAVVWGMAFIYFVVERGGGGGEGA